MRPLIILSRSRIICFKFVLNEKIKQLSPWVRGRCILLSIIQKLKSRNKWSGPAMLLPPHPAGRLMASFQYNPIQENSFQGKVFYLYFQVLSVERISPICSRHLGGVRSYWRSQPTPWLVKGNRSKECIVLVQESFSFLKSIKMRFSALISFWRRQMTGKQEWSDPR